MTDDAVPGKKHWILNVDEPGFKLDLDITSSLDPDSGEPKITINFDAAVDLQALLLAKFPQLRPQFDELDTLSQHLFPIVVGALVDGSMTELLRSFLVEGKESDYLLGSDGFTYAQKVRLTIALGLMPEALGKSALQVGHIRNHFAHEPKASLLDAKVKPELRKLLAELIRRLFGQEDAPNDPEINKMVERAKAELEVNTEETARHALRTAWLLLSALMLITGSMVTRLEPLKQDPEDP